MKFGKVGELKMSEEQIQNIAGNLLINGFIKAYILMLGVVGCIVIVFLAGYFYKRITKRESQ